MLIVYLNNPIPSVRAGEFRQKYELIQFIEGIVLAYFQIELPSSAI